MLDLNKVLAGEEKEIVFNAEYDLCEYSPDIVSGTCKVNGKVTAFHGYASFDADFDLDFTAVCARCGENFHGKSSFSASHPIAAALESADDEKNDEYIILQDGKLDTDEVCISEIILNLPTRFVCRDDCKGLCQHCGKNLNTGKCSCDGKVIDPRLEKLKHFFDN